MRLLAFELKKIIFSKKFWYVMVGLVLAIAFLFFKNILFESYIQKEARQKVDELLEISYGNSRVHNAILKDDPENEEEQERLLINSSMVNTLYEMRSMIESDDWQSKLALENQYLNRLIEYKETEGEHPLTFREIHHMIALNEKLIAENIPPEHETFSIALPNFMKQLVDLYVNLGAVLIVVLLVGDILASEFENRSANLLFTQPLKRTHIITSKFLSSIIVYLLTTFVMFIAAYFIGLFFGEKGTFEYPLIAEKNEVVGFMTISEYMTLSLLVTTVTVVLIISLCLLFSLLFKNILPTLFALLVILVLGYFLTVFVSWNPLAWFNPFQYLLPEEIILFQNGNVWYQGIPIIIVLTLVLYLVARQMVKTSKVE